LRSLHFKKRVGGRGKQQSCGMFRQSPGKKTSKACLCCIRVSGRINDSGSPVRWRCRKAVRWRVGPNQTGFGAPGIADGVLASEVILASPIASRRKTCESARKSPDRKGRVHSQGPRLRRRLSQKSGSAATLSMLQIQAPQFHAYSKNTTIRAPRDQGPGLSGRRTLGTSGDDPLGHR
jgi:hypothetical protein